MQCAWAGFIFRGFRLPKLHTFLNARPIPVYLPVLPLAAVPSFAHGSLQSAFDPKGRGAAEIAEMMWMLFIGGGAIFIGVMGLAAMALFGSAAQRNMLAREKLILGGGILFPIVVLSALLVYTFAAGTGRADGGEPPQARIEVTGELWWWRVRYLSVNGHVAFETANEIRIPAGKPTEVLLKSGNVIHSFWVPNLAGKIDMIPGHVNRLRLHADKPGVFRGQCAEYCGAQHARMALHVIAQEPAEYDAWTNSQRLAAAVPDDPVLLRGRQLFLDNRCGLCHTVRGISAAGQLGPDLTHVGSRHSLGGGILPNNSGTIAGWISGSQQIKPGNRMPSFNQFSGDELRALSTYLASLQ
ncbi:MAG TPA: cytochrome c oxidase subunit II [Noviherbaspirillum sp.]|nr:cytochrome c oxidase subunit II [Noviherbaspirillum sp.]